jgi:dTDP-4-dehydrorhamnose reductase
VNATATGTIARLAASAGARLVMVSTDLVFDGEDAPYGEEKIPRPASVYGSTKREGEILALACPGALVVRVALLFGPALGGRKGFFDAQVGALRQGEAISLFDDEWRTPLALDVAARSLVALARTEAAGTLHLGGPERMSRSEMGVRLARILGADESCILHTSRLSIPGERRVRDVSLDSTRLRPLVPGVAAQPGFEEACRAMLAT